MLISFALIAYPGTLTPSPSLGSGGPLEPCNPLHNLLSPGSMSATGDERRRARQLGEYLKHMPLHLSRNNPPYPEEVMSDLVELTVELVEPYIPHLVRVLGSYDPTYRDAARDALTRLVERGVLSCEFVEGVLELPGKQGVLHLGIKKTGRTAFFPKSDRWTRGIVFVRALLAHHVNHITR